MGFDAGTVTLLNSVLGSAEVRKLFTTIAAKRIAEAATLKQGHPDADQDLGLLKDADLIDSAQSGEKYYVTAKGLKVARDLEKLPVA